MALTDGLIHTITKRMAEAAGRPFVIAIDGHSAAGKSTVAIGLAAAWPEAALLRTDDFYRVMGPEARLALSAEEGARQYYDWERLMCEALRPLRQGRPARFQAYDWDTNMLGAWREVPAAPLVIVEGCYSARPELDSLVDFTVLVEADPALRAERQAKRADASASWLARWDAAERHHLSTTRLRQRADAIVTGE